MRSSPAKPSVKKVLAKVSTKSEVKTDKARALSSGAAKLAAAKADAAKAALAKAASAKAAAKAKAKSLTSLTAKVTKTVIRTHESTVIIEAARAAVQAVSLEASKEDSKATLGTSLGPSVERATDSGIPMPKIPIRRGGYRPGAFEATKTLAELSDEPIEFQVGDNAVYPGHGVGRVNAIETKDIAGKKLTFYSIQILESGMKIMVPQGNVKSVGLRPIISKQEADHVIGILKETNIKIDNQTWNRRYREYMEKIKTGGVREIAEVLRDLFLLKVDKELSFGERKMLDTARSLLIKELILATGRDQLEKEDDVKAILGL